MNPFPYMPYWIRDFESDPHVEAMSNCALGAYHRLLWKAWHQDYVGSLPTDDRLLALWARCPVESWDEVKREILPCFRLSRGRYVQKRMRAIYEELTAKSRDKSQRARNAALRKWHKEPDLPCNSNAPALRMQCPVGSGSACTGYDIPEQLMASAGFAQVWARWVAYRVEIRKALKDSTARAQLATMKKHGPVAAIAAMEKSIEQGWTGLFYADESKSNPTNTTGEVDESNWKTMRRNPTDEDLAGYREVKP